MVLVAGVAIQPAYASVTKVTQHVFAKGVDTSGPTWVPINLTNTFTQDDAYVYAFTEASYSQTNFTWVWHEPSGAAYYTDSNSFGCDRTSCQLYDRLAVRGTDAATKFGTWRMDLLADGKLLYSDTFELVAQGASLFTPSDIRAIYNVNPLLQSGYTGKGVTVAIIGEAIGGTFFSDVKTFSREFNLPDPNITVVQPYGTGGPSSLLSQQEITGDTEFVHAMAPDANILLVLVRNDTVHYTVDGFSYVIEHNAADVATMSYSSTFYGNGASDASTARSYNNEFAKSVGENITLISSSGDWGSNNTVPWGSWISNFWTSYLPDAYLMPTHSSYVTIVGGTTLVQQSDGTYSETGWEQSGGGPSNLFLEPSWQVGKGVPQNHRRNIPDIALDASCDTPYSFAWNNTQDLTFCGTSGSAPTFAGIVADIVQAAGGRIGFINPTLYNIAATDPATFYDVTSGCSLVVVGGRNQTGYCASKGWDAVTGWGSIDAAKLAKYFAPTATIVATSTSTSATSQSTFASVTQPLSIGGGINSVLLPAVVVAAIILAGLGALLWRRRKKPSRS
jgi:subtilase family serine protease